MHNSYNDWNKISFSEKKLNALISLRKLGEKSVFLTQDIGCALPDILQEQHIYAGR